MERGGLWGPTRRVSSNHSIATCRNELACEREASARRSEVLDTCTPKEISEGGANALSCGNDEKMLASELDRTEVCSRKVAEPKILDFIKIDHSPISAH